MNEFLNGQKTKLGATLTALAGLAAIWLPPEWAAKVGGTLGAMGILLTIWGIGHKLEKLGS